MQVILVKSHAYFQVNSLYYVLFLVLFLSKLANSVPPVLIHYHAHIDPPPVCLESIAAPNEQKCVSSCTVGTDSVGVYLPQLRGFNLRVFVWSNAPDKELCPLW